MKTRIRFSYRSAFTLAVGALFASLPLTVAAQETILFPGRSSDLATDSYWTVAEFSEGASILDFNVRRWEDGSWQGGTGYDENSQNYDWNVPLYAPADGVVISCWRNFPDDPHPGENPPNNNIFTGGNHVAILTDEGNVISLNHLKSGTIPAALCPPNAGSTQYPATMDKEESWRVAAYVEEGDRVRVQEGDFIGRVGNSGNSSGPHLHMSIQAVAGDDEYGREALAEAHPLPFRNGWANRFEADQTLASSGWHRLRGEGLAGNPDCESYQADSPECGFKHIHASPYLRRADAAAGTIKTGGDVLFLSANRAVTATVAQNNDHLRLIAWDLVGVDTWDRGGDLDGPAIKQVALSQPTSGYVLAALRLADDTLKMVAYQVTALGNFIEVADYTAGEISELDVTTIGSGDKLTITAVRTAGGDLKLIAWDVEVANNGTVTVARLGEASTGPASRIAVVKARTFTGVYTALRESGGQLMVIPWQVSSSGLTFTRGGDVTSGAAGTEIAVAALAQGVAVAMRDASGNLKLQTWSASGTNIGSLRQSATAGPVSEVGLLTTPLGESNLTTVVRDGDGNLLLIGWGVAANGDHLRRLGSSKAGGATGIAADSIMRSYIGLDPRDMIATVMRSSNGDFRLVAWDTNLVNP